MKHKISFKSDTIKLSPYMKDLLHLSLKELQREFYLDGNLHAYPNPSGDSDLISKIENLFPHVKGDVLITNSATEGLYLALNLFKGKRVAIREPIYFGVIRILSELNIGIVLFNNIADLEELDFDAVLMTTTYCPPDNYSLSYIEKEKLVNIVDSKKATLIEDNAYEFFGIGSFPNNNPIANKNIFISSFSKFVHPGFRLGFIISNYAFKEIRSLKITMNLSTSSFSQFIVNGVFHSSAITDWINELNSRRKSLNDFFNFNSAYEGPYVKIDVEDIGGFLSIADNMGIGFDRNNYYYLDNELRNYVRLFLGAFEENELEKHEILLKEFIEKSKKLLTSYMHSL
jgi:DNA-binding transcriptional MocR family regulator